MMFKEERPEVAAAFEELHRNRVTRARPSLVVSVAVVRARRVLGVGSGLLG